MEHCELRDRDFFALTTDEQLAFVPAECAHYHIPMGNRIASEHISVVIQGPIFTQVHKLAPDGITRAVVASVCQQLPNATIIMATWQGQPVDTLADLAIDKLLVLKDPQATNFYVTGYQADNPYNNCNRLIYSTQQGLAQVKTPYVLKIRSDLLMFHPLVSCFFGQFEQFDRAWQVVNQRILAFPMFSIKYEKGKNLQGQTVNQPRPFHVSDWAYFGLIEDVRKLFDCELVPEPQTSRWFETHPKPSNDIWAERLWRYSPEQYITSNLAQRTLGIHLEHASVDNADILDASERFIANNFVILDQKLWGLWSLKLQHYQDELKKFIPAGLYNLAVWRADYERFCHILQNR